MSMTTTSPAAKVPSAATEELPSPTETALPASATSVIVGQVSHVPPTSNDSAPLVLGTVDNKRLFGGSCGLTPRRRCQPGSGATRAEPVFPTEREGPARRRRRHAVAAEALAPPDAARVAIRIATRVATVYTNAPKRRREAILANLCTLLRPHVCPQQRNSVHKCPKTAPRGHFRRSVYTVASSPWR